MPVLLKDIYSSTKKGQLYGKAGETVKIIADHDNVLIVENKTGFRFPVKKKAVVL